MKQAIKHLSMLTGTVLVLSLSACGGDSGSEVADRDINTSSPSTSGVADSDRRIGELAQRDRDVTIDISPYATVEFNAADGSRTSGNIQFVGEEPNTRIIGRLANVPEGTHSLRVVQAGDCSEVTGIVSQRIGEIRSAGEDQGAALPADSGFITNITVGPDNLASIDLRADDLMLDGPMSIIGKAMIVGTASDMAPAAPAGESVDDLSNVIACGVIMLNDATSSR